MKQQQSASKRVIMNTGIMYTKMLVTMGIALYSTRLVLNALGATDYGIFSLIAGVIAMLSFLNTAMATSTQRYLSFHQGKNDFLMQKKVFSNSWILHILISITVVVLLEIACPFLFNGFLNIPTERVYTAKTVYHLVTISVAFSIVTSPLIALSTAYENMLWIAIIYTAESILKFGIALSLAMFEQNNRLIMYGLFMSCISLLSLILHATYCMKKYKECSLKCKIDIPLIKELFAFAGWNFFGVLCNVGKIQGLAILLNIFGGTIVNAAYGIANQVSVQLSSFSRTMVGTLNPQIMKSEGMDDRKRMLRLSMIASKFGFFLLAFIAIPCIFEMPAILTLWLQDVPEHTVVFCSMILIGTLVTQLMIGGQSAIQAVGRIKIFQTVIGFVLLLNLPVSYILLKWNLPIYSVLFSYIIIEILAVMFQLILLKRIVGLLIKEYFNRVFFREIFPTFMLITTCWIITHSLFFDFRFIVTSIVSIFIFSISIYFTGLCKDEKILVKTMLNKVINKLFLSHLTKNESFPYTNK
jgi:O-antigen/teichoic acid export membrane protein